MIYFDDRQHRQLGIFDPALIVKAVDISLNWWEQEKVKKLVPDFPGIFDRAVADFAKFKVGVAADLFSQKQRADVMAWFVDFPQLWETIRPNFATVGTGNLFADRVDAFVSRLQGSALYRTATLGGVPIVVAGILLVGGVAAGLWAVGYIKRQANISRMIDEVTTGALPAQVLVEAVKAEQDSGLFAGLGRFGYAIAFAAAAWLIYDFTRKR